MAYYLHALLLLIQPIWDQFAAGDFRKTQNEKLKTSKKSRDFREYSQKSGIFLSAWRHDQVDQMLIDQKYGDMFTCNTQTGRKNCLENNAHNQQPNQELWRLEVKRLQPWLQPKVQQPTTKNHGLLNSPILHQIVTPFPWVLAILVDQRNSQHQDLWFNKTNQFCVPVHPGQPSAWTWDRGRSHDGAIFGLRYCWLSCYVSLPH